MKIAATNQEMITLKTYMALKTAELRERAPSNGTKMLACVAKHITEHIELSLGNNKLIFDDICAIGLHNFWDNEQDFIKIEVYEVGFVDFLCKEIKEQYLLT